MPKLVKIGILVIIHIYAKISISIKSMVMRLSQLQIKTIKAEAIAIFGNSATVILFGSKVDDNAKGGDIDLMINVVEQDDDLWRKALRLNSNIQQKLGEQKIDIITRYHGQKLANIHKEALRTGITL
ncbi:MAG: nucleotidyltransferase domain-containing protein [Methylococcales symbiont of Hymedesmia sp. n. MRB-2018]|nr:MAG: nucleotidyltransferase domain-containing protein [Methylococcales symbiont of Hymedesmia sp. n. MRB-2018]